MLDAVDPFIGTDAADPRGHRTRRDLVVAQTAGREHTPGSDPSVRDGLRLRLLGRLPDRVRLLRTIDRRRAATPAHRPRGIRFHPLPTVGNRCDHGSMRNSISSRTFPYSCVSGPSDTDPYGGTCHDRGLPSRGRGPGLRMGSKCRCQTDPWFWPATTPASRTRSPARLTEAMLDDVFGRARTLVG